MKKEKEKDLCVAFNLEIGREKEDGLNSTIP